jgi:hypothetical protein
MLWAILLSLTVFSKSLSSWSCGLRKLGSYRPYRGTQTVGMLCAQRLDNGEHTLVRTLWSTTTFWVVAIITKCSHYVTGYIELSHCCLQIVDLVKLWPPQAPNSVTFGHVTLCWELRFEYLNGISTNIRPENFVTKLWEYRFWLSMTVSGVMGSDLSHLREITMRNKKAVASTSDGILKKSQGMTPETVESNQNLHYESFAMQYCGLKGTPVVCMWDADCSRLACRCRQLTY